ncbi:uncharacterized protein BO66DRAFT_392051 [Aspergillus aculeatinus CBS 121060]|uniref:Uncharacterized protein n=1 Tax=Aspergillus aculeatinus CBS 121060 TaxID=1448322 RepID=A0ACD1H8F5_9EURO|nr:hypothetical protein BO66DRAFT_392051 [Aspergillus aculeatinus CBS 121060]RAH69915.1 hypothetical protein BO66DRAFT_392051 [Aspergillus aculeatinus CBS 121060]
MDKVWFTLRQTDYPAPPEKALLSGHHFGGNMTASSPGNAPSITLGHIIPSLQHLDNPINAHNLLPFPIRMQVYRTTTTNFVWQTTAHDDRSTALKLAAPIAGAVTGTATPGLKFNLAFKQTVARHEEYAQLDTYIVTPTRGYIQDCLDALEEGEEFRGKVVNGKRLRAWTLFMVTGLKIARCASSHGGEGGGKREVSEEEGRSWGGGPDVDVTGLATVTATLDLAREDTSTIKGAHQSDFVWAVRLAKIHKGWLARDWSLDPYTTGATFGVEKEEDEDLDVEKVLMGEGLSRFEIVTGDEADEALMVVLDDA